MVVDDGSFQHIREFYTYDSRSQAVRFVGNFSDHMALSAGIQRGCSAIPILRGVGRTECS
jgi:hypothetical protein